MKSAHFLAYAALLAAGVNGKPCTRKATSSTVSTVASTTSSESSSYSTSSADATTTSSSESATVTTTSSTSSADEASSTTSSDVSDTVTTTTSSEVSETVVPTVTLSTTSSEVTSSADVTTSSVEMTTSSESATSTTSSTTTTSSSAAGPTQTINTTGMTFQNAILIAHNIHRANHTAPNLGWDVNLANNAAQTAMTCVYAHNLTAGGGGYGQIIGAGYTAEQTARMINDMYNTGEPNYPGPYGDNNVDLSNFASWGHFSQIVWASTLSVGCAVEYCPNGLANAPGIPPYLTVCDYSPAGNIVGAWNNVRAPIGGPTIEFLP
ncbi:CAP domain-containing protein [Hypoxylon sp. FL1284]|nr:CAP domain-containing protein [Hypoxylon sp. FL1284]